MKSIFDLVYCPIKRYLALDQKTNQFKNEVWVQVVRQVELEVESKVKSGGN